MNSVLSITAPVFLVILLGYICARKKLFPAEAQKSLSLYVFYCAMPCYLFLAMSKTPQGMIADTGYISAYIVGMAAVAALAGLAAKYFNLTGAQCILAMMSACHTNSAFIGIPIIVMAFGSPGPVVAVILFQVIIVTTLVLASIEIYKKHGVLSLNSLRELPKTALLNPIVGGSLLGIIFSIYGWIVPSIFEHSLQLLGNAAIPSALFALGLSLGFVREPLPSKHQSLVYILVGLKIIVHPGLALLLGIYVFQLQNAWLGPLVIISAMPTAMNNFIFSQRYETFEAESSQVVFLSSVISLFTLSGLLFWFTA
jgi:predicted permease